MKIKFKIEEKGKYLRQIRPGMRGLTWAMSDAAENFIKWRKSLFKRHILVSTEPIDGYLVLCHRRNDEWELRPDFITIKLCESSTLVIFGGGINKLYIKFVF